MSAHFSHASRERMAIGFSCLPAASLLISGSVFAVSAFISDERAEEQLIGQLEAPPMAEPNRLRFLAGKREKQWVGNCVAIGLSAGFLEPLESTSIHLIQLGIGKLIELFPGGGWDPLDADEFNRSMALEYERVRDFLILHYYATERADSPFWDYCRTMTIPDSLAGKLELFRDRGIVARYREGMFLEPSWIAVCLGQRVEPRDSSLLSERISSGELDRRLPTLSDAVTAAAEGMPLHLDYLAQIGATE